jgi:hypothetical protein
MMQLVKIRLMGLIPLLVLATISTGCQKSEADKPKIVRAAAALPPQSQASAPPVKTGALPKLDRASMVEIRNDWNGYSDITPILRHYRLKLDRGQLVGNAHTAVGGYGAAGVRQQQTKKVVIPAPVAQNFFVTLDRTPLTVGKYRPIVVRADDYPAISIKLTLDRQSAIFSSTSQGAGYQPWQVSVNTNGKTETYISNSDTPDRALKLLSPYLDREGIQNIIQRRRQK